MASDEPTERAALEQHERSKQLAMLRDKEALDFASRRLAAMRHGVAWFSAILGLLSVAAAATDIFSSFPRILEGLPTFSLPQIDFSEIRHFDPVTFMARYKFECAAICGMMCSLAHILINRRTAFSRAGIGAILLAFLAGSSLPAGVLFGLISFQPDRFSLLREFREFVLMAGLALVVISAIGIVEAIRPTLPDKDR